MKANVYRIRSTMTGDIGHVIDDGLGLCTVAGNEVSGFIGIHREVFGGAGAVEYVGLVRVGADQYPEQSNDVDASAAMPTRLAFLMGKHLTPDCAGFCAGILICNDS